MDLSAGETTRRGCMAAAPGFLTFPGGRFAPGLHQHGPPNGLLPPPGHNYKLAGLSCSPRMTPPMSGNGCGATRKGDECVRASDLPGSYFLARGRCARIRTAEALMIDEELVRTYHQALTDLERPAHEVPVDQVAAYIARKVTTKQLRRHV